MRDRFAPAHGTNPYGTRFFAEQVDPAARSAARLVPSLVETLRPSSVLDVGCGTGSWSAAFLAAGVPDVIGIDGSYVPLDRLRIPGERFVAADLAGPFAGSRRADLVVCLEVAEHLPEAVAGAFVAELVSVAPLVLFSAAVPHQGGTEHVNERWQEHWRRVFATHGRVAVDIVRHRFWDDPEVEPYYLQNAILYATTDAVDRHDLAGHVVPDDWSLDVVHPRLWETRAGGSLTLRPLLQALPGALSAALRRRAG